MSKKRMAVILGDGTGRHVMFESMRVADAAPHIPPADATPARHRQEHRTT